MESIVGGLAGGFATALDGTNLLYVTIGVLIGTVVGLLPGLGPTAAIALLLPFTYGLDAATAVIMLAGIYYGSMFGGRIPAILLNLPGDSSAVVTTFDGYPLRLQGRAGEALGITAIGSFLGGTVAIVGLTLFAPTLAVAALRMGPPELFVLTLFGVLMIVFLASGGLWAGLATAGFGMLLGAVGRDPITADWRLTAGFPALSDGISIVPLAVGLFGLAEVFVLAENRLRYSGAQGSVDRILPRRNDWLVSRWAIVRASIIGFFIGIVPGGGGTVSSIIAYGAEKRISKHPEKFGKGAIEGLTATETADNASSNAAFIPLLTLGLPPNAVMGLIFGALVMHNVTPGPRLIETDPDIFWGVIASMYIGSVLLLIINLPLIRVFVQILKVPGPALMPVVVGVAVFGVYSVNNRIFDIWLAVAFGLVGYLLKKIRVGAGPMILGFVLAPIMEAHWRRTLLISDGSLNIFIDRPIALLMVVIVIVISVYSVLRDVKRVRRNGRGVASTSGRAAGSNE